MPDCIDAGDRHPAGDDRASARRRASMYFGCERLSTHSYIVHLVHLSHLLPHSTFEPLAFPRAELARIFQPCAKINALGDSNCNEGGRSVKRHILLGASVAVLFASAAAWAQNNPSNLDKLGQFKTTGASPNIPTIPQGGAKAAALKKNLEKIKLPHGFHIGLYAIVPDARHMAVGPQGIVTFVGTRKAQVYAVTDRSKSGVAEEVKPFASTISLVIPNGPCFSKDGFLFV